MEQVTPTCSISTNRFNLSMTTATKQQRQLSTLWLMGGVNYCSHPDGQGAFWSLRQAELFPKAATYRNQFWDAVDAHSFCQRTWRHDEMPIIMLPEAWLGSVRRAFLDQETQRGRRSVVANSVDALRPLCAMCIIIDTKLPRAWLNSSDHYEDWFSAWQEAADRYIVAQPLGGCTSSLMEVTAYRHYGSHDCELMDLDAQWDRT